VAQRGGREEIDRERALPGVAPRREIGRQRRVIGVGAGVVDEQIDAAEPGDRLAPEAGRLVGRGEVGGEFAVAGAGQRRERRVGGGVIGLIVQRDPAAPGRRGRARWRGRCRGTRR